MSRYHAFALLLFVPLASSAANLDTQTLGLLTSAHKVSCSVLAITELGLEKTDVRAISFRRREFDKAYRKRVGQLLRAARTHAVEDPAQFFASVYVGMEDDVTAINQAFLDDALVPFEEKRLRRRYRQLLTQMLVRSGNFEAICRLNSIPLDADTFVEMVRRREEANKSLRETIGSDVALRSACFRDELVAQRVLDEQQASDFYGEPFSINENHRFPEAIDERYFDPLPFWMLARPAVQVEIGLGVSGVRQIVDQQKVIAKMRAAHSEMDALAFADAESARELANQLRRDAETVNDFIESVLGEEQLRRFNQLLFQTYLQSARAEEALKIYGIEIDSQQSEKLNRGGHTETSYRLQVYRLQAFRPVFDWLTKGDGDQFVGKSVIVPMTDYLEDPEADKARQARHLAALSGEPAERSSNPRRRDRR